MKQISKKAYSELVGRINETFSVMLNDGDMAVAAVAAVNDYLENDIVPAADAPMEIQIAFGMVRTEIDRAVERSRKARERAMKRRKTADDSKSVAKPKGEKIEKKVTEPEVAASPTPVMKNRRQRRLEEQELCRFRRKNR